ncbi:MAG: UbiD family decarboxylase [Burkholderiales bacterium]|nr:UbiD family decarboxylase [Burkholderiales bacterium]
MDFRSVVKACEAAGDVSRVEAIIGRSALPERVRHEERRGNRALVFEHVEDTPARIVGNLYGSAKRVCRALGAPDYATLFARLDQAIANPATPVRRATALDDVDVIGSPDLPRQLPVMRYSRHDAAPYLTSSILLVRDPASGVHHLCFVRMAVDGGNELLVNPATTRIRRIVETALQRGDTLPVAILVGAPSAITLLGCVNVGADVDKLAVAQALAGNTLGFTDDALPIPVGCEYVLTGRIVPRYAREGPVGDQKGLYSLRARNPTCVVDALHVRRDPWFHSVSGGVSREHVELVTLGPRAVLERIKRDTPELLRYELPHHAGGRLGVLVVADGFRPAALAERLWAISSVRGFVAVNRDVGARRAADVLWAIVERARDASQFAFSPSGLPGIKPGKFFIDATESDLGDWNHRRIDIFRPRR